MSKNEQETDWQQVSNTLMHTIITILSCYKPDRKIYPIIDAQLGKQTLNDFICDCMEQHPGCSIDREIMAINVLPKSKQKKARKKLKKKRAKKAAKTKSPSIPNTTNQATDH